MFRLFSVDRFVGRKPPKTAVFPVAPDLAIEHPFRRKRTGGDGPQAARAFQAGVRLVWYIEPTTRTVRAYTAKHQWTEVGPNDLLLGGDVLPGFKLPLAQLFARVEGPEQQ